MKHDRRLRTRAPFLTVALLATILCPFNVRSGFAAPPADPPAGGPPPAAAPAGKPPRPPVTLPRKRLHLLPRQIDPNLPNPGATGHLGLLASELARQAVLFAAREELGLPTRDFALGDAVSPQDLDAAIVATSIDPRGAYALLIAPEPKGPRPFERQQRQFAFQAADGLINYAEISAKLELLSREVLPAALEQAGFARLPQAPEAEAGAVDPVTAKLLTRFSPLAQLAAVRRLHEIRRTSIRSGPQQSADVLDALATGYANLAMLARQVWSEQPVVYQARALLYGQRLWALDRNSSRGLWRLAYVLDMIGADWLLQSLVEDADELAKQDGKEPPPWRGAMLGRLRYDPTLVQAWMAAEGQADEYAAVQLFRSHAGDWWPTALSGKLAMLFVERMHGGCTPITRRLASRGCSIGEGHVGNGISERALAEDVKLFVEHAGQLPAAARKGLEADNPLGTVPKALMKTGLAADQGEPSSRACGRLMAELNMLSVNDELGFLSGMLGVDPGEVVQRRLPMLDPHELKGYVIFGIDARWQPRQTVTLPDRFVTPRLAQQSAAVFSSTKVAGKNVGLEMLRQAIACSDDLSDDQTTLARVTEGKSFRDQPGNTVRLQEIAARWVRVSPHRAPAHMRASWPDRAGRLPEVEALRDWARHPETSDCLTLDLTRIGEHALAMMCLEEAVPLHHDGDQYARLAALYKLEGRMTAWRRTLDDYIRHPDSGLGPAHAQADIADYLVAEGRPAEALPYAKSAAESFSQRSLAALANTFEALGEADDAAGVHMAMLDRYGGSGMDWYAAMVRMGAARGAARERLAATIKAGQGQDWEVAALAEAEGDVPAALAAWERDARADAESSLAVLEFPMLLGDKGEKDRQLKLMRETGLRLQPKKTFLGELAIRLAADIEHPGQLSPARVERLVSEKNRDSRIMFEYFLGWRLVQAGHREAGRAHLASAAIKPMHNPLLAMLARIRLTELDAGPQRP